MSDSTNSISRQLVVFSLGEEEYALPIGHVQEILFYTAPRPVASGEPWVTGVISLRGKIIAVYDLAARLGVVGERDENAKIVIVESGADRAGIVVDDVAEVLIVENQDLEELPTAAENELLEAIAKVGDRLVVLLNLDGLVADGSPAAAGAASAGTGGAGPADRAVPAGATVTGGGAGPAGASGGSVAAGASGGAVAARVAGVG